MSTKLARKKIDSPLAKYNSAGQLYCVLCNAQVKNEMFWTAHVNGKTHRDMLLNLKQKKSGPPTAPAAHVFKRPAPVDDVPPTKVMKLDEPKKSTVELAEQELESIMVEEDDTRGNDEVESLEETPRHLPEGFFDDPKEDAKARGQKFRDPQEVEWEKFVKEIATEDLKSTEIVVEEDQDRAVDRELEHLEDQMVAWQRVIQLEKRAEELGKLKQNRPAINVQEVNSEDKDDDDEELEYDEEMDWRNKKR